MNKKTGTIITGIIGVIFLAAAVAVFFVWRSDVKYYEAQLAEYDRGVEELKKSVDGGSGELTEARQQIVQLESDLATYKEAIDRVNAERVAAKEENEAIKKANEDKEKKLGKYGQGLSGLM